MLKTGICKYSSACDRKHDLELLFRECTQDCPPPPSVFYDVTFNVNMQNEVVSNDGVYLAGGAHFGGPGDNPMSDEDGDGIWSITMSLAEGTSGNYTFLNEIAHGGTARKTFLVRIVQMPTTTMTAFSPQLWATLC